MPPPTATRSASAGPRALVLMGVAGAGKTTVGLALARRLGWAFLDADAFHDASAVDQMRHGEGLADRDREAWLGRLAARLAARLALAHGADTPLVLACSALREAYRTTLARAHPALAFVWLDAPPHALRRRLQARTGHFAGPGLLPSQLATLEPPTGALRADATRAPEALAAWIADRLGLSAEGPAGLS